MDILADMRAIPMPLGLYNAARRQYAGSVFLRLVVSYILLVAIATFVTALSAFLFFQGKFNRELESVHDYIVRRAEREVEAKVIEAQASVYMECATQILRADSDFLGEGVRTDEDAYKIYATHEYLRGLASRFSDRVIGIHIYYRAADLIVSSASGLHINDGAAGQGIGSSWIAALSSAGARQAWIPVGSDSASRSDEVAAADSGPFIRAIRCFPILSDAADCSVVIAADFSLADLRSAIAGPPSSGTGLTFLVAGSGTLIASSAEIAPDAELEAIAREASIRVGETPVRAGDTDSRAGDGGGGYFRSFRGAKSYVSALRVANSDWVLVNITRSAILYGRGDSLGLGLLVIWVAAILAGAALALVLGARMYDPLGRLMERVRGLFGIALPPRSGAKDEYGVLDFAIEDLSSRMEELDATLRKNRPMMKHELVARFLNDDPPRPEELEDTLRLIGAPGFDGPCAAVLAYLDPRESPAEPGSGVPGREDARVLKYRLAEAFELGGGGSVIVATFPGAELGMIAALETAGIEAFLRSWSRAAEGLFGVSLTLCAGSAVGSRTELARSFVQARRLSSYRFFFPELRLFFGREDLLAREGRSEELPKSLLDSLAEALRLGSRKGFDEALSAVYSFARSDRSSAERCMSELLRVLHLVADVGAALLPRGAQAFRERVLGLLAASRDIGGFVASLSSEAAGLFAAVEERAEDRSSALVEKVKAFIDAHLDGDLSLDRASEAVGLSPSYLSTLFKEVAGESYVAYVTNARIAKAERLLVEGEASVQEIGRFVGFNSPAYFIKQFKARYGATPIDYRRSGGRLP